MFSTTEQQAKTWQRYTRTINLQVYCILHTLTQRSLFLSFPFFWLYNEWFVIISFRLNFIELKPKARNSTDKTNQKQTTQTAHEKETLIHRHTHTTKATYNGTNGWLLFSSLSNDVLFKCKNIYIFYGNTQAQIPRMRHRNTKKCK